MIGNNDVCVSACLDLAKNYENINYNLYKTLIKNKKSIIKYVLFGATLTTFIRIIEKFLNNFVNKKDIQKVFFHHWFHHMDELFLLFFYDVDMININ